MHRDHSTATPDRPLRRSDGSLLKPLDVPAAFLSLYALLALFPVPEIPTAVPVGVALLLFPGWAVSRRAASRVYRHAWNAVSAVCIAIVVALYLFFAMPPHVALALICLFLILQRWFLPRGLREHVEIWALSVLLVTTGAFDGGGLFGIAVQVGWALASLQLLNLIAVVRTQPRVTAEIRPVYTPVEGSPYRIAPMALRSGFVLVPLFALVAAAVMMLAPRTQVPEASPLPAEQLDALGSAAIRTGFSEFVNLRSLTTIHETGGIAFRLISPPSDLTPSRMRFRVSTLDRFNGWEWQRSEALRSSESATQLRPAFSIFGLSAIAFEDDIALSGRPLEPVLLRISEFPRELIPLPRQAVAIEGLPSDVRVVVEADGKARFDQERPPGEYYLLLDRSRDRSPLQTGPVLPSHTALAAPIEGMVRQASREIAAGAREDTLERARAVESHLRRNGRYTLTYDGAREGPQALRHFLTRGMEGHCELFATAMALILRADGIPTRLVTGFNGAEAPDQKAGTPRQLIVPHRNAHAWVEVWDETQGWVAFDPTPSPPLTLTEHRMARSGWTGYVGERAAALAGWIENYDHHAQKRLRAQFNEKVAGLLGSWEGGALLRAWDRFHTNLRETPILLLTLALLLVNLAAWTTHRLWRNRRLHRLRATISGTTNRPAPPLFCEVQRVLRLSPIAPGTSPAEAILQSTRAATPESAAIERLARLYNQWRYGGTNPGLEHEIRGLLRQIVRR